MSEPTDKRTKEYKDWNSWKEQLPQIFVDARSEEYKNFYSYEKFKVWKANQGLSIGLGDAVATITEATGIKEVVETIATKLGKDCGCEDRKRLLNKLKLPLRVKAVRCFTEEQYETYKTHVKTRTLYEYPMSTARMLIDLFAHVFAIQYNIQDFAPNCGGCAKKLNNMEKKLDIVFKSYE